VPKVAPSGIKGLYKHHGRKCNNRKYPEDCDCSWKGKYKGADEVLKVWAGVEVDPRDKDAAEVIFTRMKAAIDGKRFDDRGESKSLGSDQLLTALIKDDYIKDYVDTAGFNGGPLASKATMLTTLNVIQTEKHAGVILGDMTLSWIAGNSKRIKEWLDAAAVERPKKWSPKTWNDYHQKLNGVCVWAMTQIVNDVPKMAKNPMKDIPTRRTRNYSEPNPKAITGGRIPPEIEAKLFAACDILDAPRASQARKLTQAKADAIREAVADGQEQRLVAKKFKVSGSTVSDIVKGKIWTGKAHRQTENKGSEMRRRLIGGLDGGLRAQEMLLTQVYMVDWRGVMVDGERLLPILLSPEESKGGKTTGNMEAVFATTKRFIAMLEERREQLNRNPKAFIFGTEAGEYQGSFAKQYRKLYDTAGLVHGVHYGRDLGLVWHTTRAEYASTASDANNGNEKMGMKLTRIKDTKTFGRYNHAYDIDVLRAAVKMRGNK
jgi:hypothetical protein